MELLWHTIRNQFNDAHTFYVFLIISVHKILFVYIYIVYYILLNTNVAFESPCLRLHLIL